jgi:hypothetical protein
LNVAVIGSVSGASLATAGVLDAVKIVEDLSGIVDPSKTGFILSPTDARLLRILVLRKEGGEIAHGRELPHSRCPVQGERAGAIVMEIP